MHCEFTSHRSQPLLSCIFIWLVNDVSFIASLIHPYFFAFSPPLYFRDFINIFICFYLFCTIFHCNFYVISVIYNIYLSDFCPRVKCHFIHLWRNHSLGWRQAHRRPISTFHLVDPFIAKNITGTEIEGNKCLLATAWLNKNRKIYFISLKQLLINKYFWSHKVVLII